jgi:hypothetical protein
MEHKSADHDEIHLPGPSIAPLLAAAGITLTLLGIAAGPLFGFGIVILVIGAGLWVLMPG